MFGNALGNAIVSGMQNRAKPAQASLDTAQTFGLADAQRAPMVDLPPEAMGGVSSAVQMATASLAWPAVSADGTPILDTVYVTGDAARDQQFMRYWDWSQMNGFRAPTAGEDLKAYYRTASAWVANDPRTATYQAWSASANQAVFASNGKQFARSVASHAAPRPGPAMALPSIENLYSPRVGMFESNFSAYTAMFADSNGSFGDRALGFFGALVNTPFAAVDALASGIYNAGNHAYRSGQYLARAQFLTGHDKILANLHGVQEFMSGAQGLGDAAVMGQASMLMRRSATTSGASVGAAAAEITGGSQALYELLPARLRTKTVATDGSANTISGYGASLPDGYTYVNPNAVIQRAREIGHDLRPAGAMDQGIPGQYNASHAEKQVIVNNPRASQVDVSRPMCTDCQGFFRAEASAQGRAIVISDPIVIRTYYPNGQVVIIPRTQ